MTVSAGPALSCAWSGDGTRFAVGTMGGTCAICQVRSTPFMGACYPCLMDDALTNFEVCGLVWFGLVWWASLLIVALHRAP